MPKPKLPFKQFEWTPKLAYVVGLLVTDGNLSSDGRHIIMRSADRSLLETFRSCLDLENKIGESHDHGPAGREYYRIQFGDVQFYKWLVSIGVTPAKSRTVGFIKIPEEYFIDFLRGHLDGDGTVRTYQDRYNIYKNRRYLNTRIYTLFLSASEEHIRWLHGKIKKIIGIGGALIIQKPPKDKPQSATMYKIKFAKYESLELFKQLYYKKNLPTLERKRIIAERLLRGVTKGKLVRLA